MVRVFRCPPRIRTSSRRRARRMASFLMMSSCVSRLNYHTLDLPVTELPKCRWRGEIEGDLARCNSYKLIKANGRVPLSVCMTCYCADHEPVPITRAESVVRVEPCIHLGAMVREQVCPTCQGTVRIKVFECQIHGSCSI